MNGLFSNNIINNYTSISYKAKTTSDPILGASNFKERQ